MSDWSRWIAGELAGIEISGRWRALRTFDARGPEGLVDGRKVVSFAGNDYLGLSAHPAVAAAAQVAIDRWGTGATASRLIVGDRPVHDELEAELAAGHGADAAVVFPTGFAANLGVLTVFGGPGVTVFSDELNHASIIDGCRLSRARVERYRHNDLEHLGALMAQCDTERMLVVSDAVFSMDGDEAHVRDLADLCARQNALLVLDEAHAVLGPELPSDPGCDLVRVGTLSKTFGALGGYVTGSRAVVDLLVNRARSFIFTTGLPPADAAAALTSIRICRSAEGAQLRDRLRANVARIRPGHPSPIVPVLVGDESAALAVAAALLEQGVLVPAIRPPTVAPGTCRLRIALSAAHSGAMMDQLCTALRNAGIERMGTHVAT